MNRYLMMLIGLAALVSAGCSTPSIHPLYAPESLIQDSGLVGEWATEGPTVTRVVITEAPSSKYSGALTVHQNAELKTGLALEVSLTRIGKDEYVDLFLARSERERLAGKYGFLALPVHQFMLMQQEGDVLRVWTFDAEWIKRAGQQNAFACDVLLIGGRDIAVVTADTGTLRGFLEKHAHDEGALSPPIVFHRAGGGAMHTPAPGS
jgi:hypothetical protein